MINLDTHQPATTNDVRKLMIAGAVVIIGLLVLAILTTVAG